MRNRFFKDIKPRVSNFPPDFIPKDAKPFTRWDPAAKGKDCTVRGFFLNGEVHIQSVEYREERTGKQNE